MKNIMALALVLTVLFSKYSVAKETQDPFNLVQELFAAMSAKDHDAMRAVATDDFQLLEVGEDWSMTDLTNVVKPNKFKRRNFFNVIRQHQVGDMVWVSYWNKALLESADEQRERTWLESAVMVKVNGQWKIQMLHSTRIKPEDLPKHIELTEYVKK